jgi:hypothetical protein
VGPLRPERETRLPEIAAFAKRHIDGFMLEVFRILKVRGFHTYDLTSGVHSWSALVF